MNDDPQNREQSDSGSTKSKEPRGGGDPVQQAHKWGGGSKASKGEVTAEDRANDQSSARS